MGVELKTDYRVIPNYTKTLDPLGKLIGVDFKKLSYPIVVITSKDNSKGNVLVFERQQVQMMFGMFQIALAGKKD